jgi:hypothetical protein
MTAMYSYLEMSFPSFVGGGCCHPSCRCGLARLKVDGTYYRAMCQPLWSGFDTDSNDFPAASTPKLLSQIAAVIMSSAPSP